MSLKWLWHLLTRGRSTTGGTLDHSQTGCRSETVGAPAKASHTQAAHAPRSSDVAQAATAGKWDDRRPLLEVLTTGMVDGNCSDGRPFQSTGANIAEVELDGPTGAPSMLVTDWRGREGEVVRRGEGDGREGGRDLRRKMKGAQANADGMWSGRHNGDIEGSSY